MTRAQALNHLTHARFTIEALTGLVLYDLVAVMGFARTHALVRRCPTVKRRRRHDPTSQICDAVAEACIWYVRRVRCLQRSTIATWLLRLHGVPAELVVGCRAAPVRSHAWVEVGGRIVNDRPQYQKFFQVLERL